MVPLTPEPLFEIDPVVVDAAVEDVADPAAALDRHARLRRLERVVRLPDGPLLRRLHGLAALRGRGVAAPGGDADAHEPGQQNRRATHGASSRARATTVAGPTPASPPSLLRFMASSQVERVCGSTTHAMRIRPRARRARLCLRAILACAACGYLPPTKITTWNMR